MKKLETFTIVTIVVYIAISVIVWYYFNNTLDLAGRQKALFIYALGTQYFLYFCYYIPLRNPAVYIFWCIIGLIHFYAFMQLRYDVSLIMYKGHAATGLRNTIIVLGLFQILRIISVITQGLDLVAVSKGFSSDPWGERSTTPIDYLLFFIFIGATAALPFI